METETTELVSVVEIMALMEAEKGCTMARAADLVLAGLELSDAELHIGLETVAGVRDAKLKERSALDLPPCFVAVGEPLPGPKTLDGQILRIGVFLNRLQSEYVKRSLSPEHAAEYRGRGVQELGEVEGLLS